MSLRIAQITDLHLTANGEPLMGLDTRSRLERVLQDASGQDVDAYVLTGDFCAHTPEQVIFDWLSKRLKRLPKPYYLLVGNHDNRAMMRKSFALGEASEAPLYGHFTVNNQELIYLDTGMGAVDDEQLAWLRNALQQFPEAPVFMHYPPLKTGSKFMDQRHALSNTDEVMGVLRAGGPRSVFCGHQHSGRSVHTGALNVYVCPPTSFFINPAAAEFEQVKAHPAYQILEWTDRGELRVIVRSAGPPQ